MKTTLNKIRQHAPCKTGWAKLLKHLNKTTPDDEPLPLLTILESNGLDDTLWCLRAVDGLDREKRLLAIAFAREVQHLMTDPRSLAALEVAERFANGESTQEGLELAALAARAAAYAAYAAADAAYAAAYAAYAAAYATYAAAADASAAAYAAAADASAASAMKNKQTEILKAYL
jgi:hypothetical protein